MLKMLLEWNDPFTKRVHVLARHIQIIGREASWPFGAPPVLKKKNKSLGVWAYSPKHWMLNIEMTHLVSSTPSVRKYKMF
jgi:hypothetical protein